MRTYDLADVTIHLDARADLAADNLPLHEAEEFVVAFRAAAEAICAGHASVTVEEVSCSRGASTGCSREWAEDFGLWQAVHDCVRHVDTDERWTVSAAAVSRVRRDLAIWRSRNDPNYQQTQAVD